ncbi:MAG: rhomboid family intramembrane serine protease [Hyphomicrobiales bacterium]
MNNEQDFSHKYEFEDFTSEDIVRSIYRLSKKYNLSISQRDKEISLTNRINNSDSKIEITTISNGIRITRFDDQPKELWESKTLFIDCLEVFLREGRNEKENQNRVVLDINESSYSCTLNSLNTAVTNPKYKIMQEDPYAFNIYTNSTLSYFICKVLIDSDKLYLLFGFQFGYNKYIKDEIVSLITQKTDKQEESINTSTNSTYNKSYNQNRVNILLNKDSNNKNNKLPELHARGFIITPILFLINFIMFFIMSIDNKTLFYFDHEILLNYGGNIATETLNGSIYRLLTSTFIHEGFLHFIMNMGILIYIGIFLEPIMGKIRYLATYLLTGIFASCVSLLFNDYVISIGASGAIFGIFGAFLPYVFSKKFDKVIRVALFYPSSAYILFSMISNFLNQGVDNAAHVGGLVSGLLISIAYTALKTKIKTKYSELRATSLITMTSLIITLIVLYPSIQSLKEYSQRTEKIEEYNENISNTLVDFENGDITLSTEDINYWLNKNNHLDLLLNKILMHPKISEYDKERYSYNRKLTDAFSKYFIVQKKINQNSIDNTSKELENAIKLYMETQTTLYAY